MILSVFKKYLPVFLSTFLVFSCSTNDTEPKEIDRTAIPEESEPANSIKMETAPVSVPFTTASLSLDDIKINRDKTSENVHFVFNLENYELGTQTSDAQGKNLAESDKGQHIHLILDNEPYSAHYENEFDKTIGPGHHVALAFLSRSYHESVKTPGAYTVFQFDVGDGSENIDLDKPHMFYSRPKGEYKGEDADKILLDFFLINATLSEDGYRVKVTVNDEETFTVSEWKAFVLENLPNGKNTVQLELIDPEGNTVDSPFNPVERTFMVSR